MNCNGNSSYIMTAHTLSDVSLVTMKPQPLKAIATSRLTLSPKKFVYIQLNSNPDYGCPDAAEVYISGVLELFFLYSNLICILHSMSLFHHRISGVELLDLTNIIF